MKIGAGPRQVMILGGLLALAAGIYFWPSDDTPPEAKAARAAAAAARSGSSSTPSSGGGAGVVSAAPSSATATTAATAPRADAGQLPNLARAGSQSRSNEFRPRIGDKDKRAERLSPDAVDPTLQLERLAKVQQVAMGGGERSLFDFAAAPPPKVAPIRVAGDGIKTPNISDSPIGPQPAPPPPPPPPPPPITLKFYGFVNSPTAGHKRAFFIEGDDIFVGAEGEVVKRHYKIVRIGVNSVVVEDTDNQNRQTLPLEEQPG